MFVHHFHTYQLSCSFQNGNNYSTQQCNSLCMRIICVFHHSEKITVLKIIKQVHYVTNWINRISGHRAEPHETANVQMCLAHVMFDATMVPMQHKHQDDLQVSFITLQRDHPSIKTTFFTHMWHLGVCLMPQCSPCNTNTRTSLLHYTAESRVPSLY